MRSVTLTRETTQQGNFILVNKEHPLAVRPESGQLRTFGSTGIPLEKKTALVLENLFGALGCHSSLLLVSGYRTKAGQEEIYSSSLKENGPDFTRKYVALPDCSEHQTGLAADLALNRRPVDFLRPYFPREGICQSFRAKMASYGFIERYPEGKEQITGIAPEPWHFRYVGMPHASLMEQHGFCLEEYLEYLTGFPAEGKHLNIQIQNQAFEIFWQKLEEEPLQVQLPADAPFLVSGTNTGGCIFTLWR